MWSTDATKDGGDKGLAPEASINRGSSVQYGDMQTEHQKSRYPVKLRAPYLPHITAGSLPRIREIRQAPVLLKLSRKPKELDSIRAVLFIFGNRVVGSRQNGRTAVSCGN